MSTLHYCINALLIGGLLFSTPSMAEPFIPASSDMVVATWPVRDQADSATFTLERAIRSSESLLERASQPGQSYLYSIAKTTLTPWIENDQQNAVVWVLWARIQQNKHDFEGAKKSLQKALSIEPNNINANLILARIHLILREYDLADGACKALLRSGDFSSSSVCKLELESHQGKLSQSYEKLSKIAAGLAANDAKKVWVNALLADMAARQGLLLESEALLDKNYDENNISALIDWADIKLALKKHNEVDKKLSAVVQGISSSEDALLVRLAIAEIELNKNKPQSEPSRLWQNRIKERVTLRELRHDLYHASDITIFYLDIEPNQQKALYWAELNWQQAQEYKDETLLQRARNMSPAGKASVDELGKEGVNDESH